MLGRKNDGPLTNGWASTLTIPNAMARKDFGRQFDRCHIWSNRSSVVPNLSIHAELAFLKGSTTIPVIQSTAAAFYR